MEILRIDLPKDLAEVERVSREAFSATPDSSLEDWFSFEEMSKAIQEGKGSCLKAISDSGEIVGAVYAQQENPINGREGKEKWVIILTAVLPNKSGKGVGTQLLMKIEDEAAKNGATKMFVFTNESDERVVNFYRKNGYADAGRIQDYQYGNGNSAVFLLKHLG